MPTRRAGLLEREQDPRRQRLPGGRPAEIDPEERSGASGDCGKQPDCLGQQLLGVETGGADLVTEEGCIGAVRAGQQPGRGKRRPGQQPVPGLNGQPR